MNEGAITEIGGMMGLGGELPGDFHFGIQGPAGPYYIPNVSQDYDRTVEIKFTPSASTMPSVGPFFIDVFSPVAKVEHTEDGAILTVTDGYGTTSAVIKNGKDGYTPKKGVDYFDGKDGKDGYTPKKGVDYFDGKDGKDGTDGKTPVKGEDYYTETDKEEIVNLVLEEIDIPDVSVEIPTFDLAAMGMTAVTLPAGSAAIATDTTALVSALSAGAVQFKIPVSMGGNNATFTATMYGFYNGAGAYQCIATAMLDIAMVAMININSNGISVTIAPFASVIGLPAVTAADNDKILQVVNGAWSSVPVADSAVKTFVDEYISSALEGDY